MKLNFTSLFDINYLAKGIALYNSLLSRCADFHLYIFAVDEICFKILKDQNLSHCTVITLHEIEDQELLSVKANRSISEYCWTCKPFILNHCIETFGLSNCTYLDGDLYFYKDPVEIITSMGDSSVLITPHNYYSAYDQSATSGIYCAGFVTFKNTVDGRQVLNWWKGACVKWCHSYYEGGKWADQKYLDSWPYMFKGVYVCKNVYAGIAPWNAINYQTQHDIENIIFYHFHDLQYLSDGSWFTGGYRIPEVVLNNIYRPYIKTLKSVSKEVTVDCLNTKDKKTFGVLTTKYKLGIYIIDLKAAWKAFINALFFIKRRNFYRKNFIR